MERIPKDTAVKCIQRGWKALEAGKAIYPEDLDDKHNGFTIAETESNSSDTVENEALGSFDIENDDEVESSESK
jgi:hypothetical protein